MTLSGLTVSRIGEQQRRERQTDLTMAAESATNEVLSWLQNNDGAIAYLKDMAVTSTPAFPTTTTSTSLVLVSTNVPVNFPSGMASTGAITPAIPAAFPALVGSDPVAMNATNVRNGCTVASKIIKIVPSGAVAWPSGNERFMVYTTATQGSGKTLRRQRVSAVIRVSRISESIFTRAMFSIAGYTFKGSATTDSWNSASGTVAYSTGIAGSNGGLGSNGTLDVQKPENVAGPYEGNLNIPVNPVPYNPPAVIASTTTASLTAYNNVVGALGYGNQGGNVTAILVPNISDNMVFGGAGTVKLYVNGVMNLADITFAPGSTVKLEIYQNTYSGGAESQYGKTNFGDLTNPSRLQIYTNHTGSGKVNGGTNWSAVLFGPNLTLRFNGNASYYGSMVVGSLAGLVNGNFAFHYDDSLAQIPVGSALPRLTAAAWFNRDLTFSEP
ncbi:MAG: hypothetical protein H0W72_13420, partial [Planctomycetes bacterium]|nr:hypothetical protein [Planctomycetota bacterium]